MMRKTYLLDAVKPAQQVLLSSPSLVEVFINISVKSTHQSWTLWTLYRQFCEMDWNAKLLIDHLCSQMPLVVPLDRRMWSWAAPAWSVLSTARANIHARVESLARTDNLYAMSIDKCVLIFDNPRFSS